MSHNYARIVFHATWTTYKRMPLITFDVERSIRDCIAAQCDRLACRLLAFGAAADHVHLLVKTPASLAPSALLQAAKGASGRLLVTTLRQPVAWQNGYFLMSVWPDDLDDIRAYVLNQRVRHQSRRVRSSREPL